MHPILFKIGSFNIYSYGVMVALGFALATFLIYKKAPQFNIDKDRIVDLTTIMLISGIAGGRLFYVFLNSGYYLSNPMEIADLSRGGLVWYGGFLSAILAMSVYLAKYKIRFWQAADLVAPFLALAQAIGRIGCFLNGCCYGIGRHPVQLYASASLFAIFVILSIWQKRRHFTGEVFLGYCILYSTKRFLMEFLRGDNPRILYGLTISQLISIGVLSVAVIIFIIKAAEWKKRP